MFLFFIQLHEREKEVIPIYLLIIRNTIINSYICKFEQYNIMTYKKYYIIIAL